MRGARGRQNELGEGGGGVNYMKEKKQFFVEIDNIYFTVGRTGLYRVSH